MIRWVYRGASGIPLLLKENPESSLRILSAWREHCPRHGTVSGWGHHRWGFKIGEDYIKHRGSAHACLKSRSLHRAISQTIRTSRISSSTTPASEAICRVKSKLMHVTSKNLQLRCPLHQLSFYTTANPHKSLWKNRLNWQKVHLRACQIPHPLTCKDLPSSE